MSGLSATYDAQRAPINQELAALPGQQAADQAGLDTAKTNAFGDITNAAGARGVLYSGAPIDEQNKYVGEKYLPAVAGLKSNYLGKQSQLQQQLATIGTNQSNAATSEHNAQLAADEKAANDQANLELKRETAAQTLALKQSTAAAKTPKDPYSVTRDKSGGYQFAGPGGVPVTAAQYYAAHGGTWQDVANFIQNSSSNAQLKADVGKLNQQQLTQKYPYIFGGV
jgi:hypothetical protein